MEKISRFALATIAALSIGAGKNSEKATAIKHKPVHHRHKLTQQEIDCNEVSIGDCCLESYMHIIRMRGQVKLMRDMCPPSRMDELTDEIAEAESRAKLAQDISRRAKAIGVPEDCRQAASVKTGN